MEWCVVVRVNYRKGICLTRTAPGSQAVISSALFVEDQKCPWNMEAILKWCFKRYRAAQVNKAGEVLD